MDWMEWVIVGTIVSFFVGFGIVVTTAIRHANKS